MATETTLSDIAAGEATPEQALAVLSEVLRRGEPTAAQQAYVSLRAWVWKALNARRRDPELRAWFDVLRRMAAFLKTRDAALAERVATLHELVQESIAVAERLPVDDVIRKRHVKDIIAMLIAAPGERLDRAVIGERTGLKQGNLTRVLNMVADAGLAERTAHGKHAEFQLTRGGRAAADQMGLRMPAKAERSEAAKL